MRLTEFNHQVFAYDVGRRIGDANGVFATTVLNEAVTVLHTDAGLVGTAIGGRADELARLWPLLENQDPRSVRGLRQLLDAAVFKTGPVASAGTIAAIENALWDIKSQAAGEPLWRLLGARTRRVPLYASGLEIGLADDDVIELYTRFADLGIASAKVKVGRDIDLDIARLELISQTIRDRVGRVDHMMIDTNEYLDPKLAVQAVRRMHAAVPLLWVEERAERDDLDGLRFVRDHVEPLVASGENLVRVTDLARLVTSGAVDVVQLSGALSITDALQTAAVAESHHRAVSVVSATAHVMAHAVCCMTRVLPYEYKFLDVPGFLEVDYVVDDGHLVLGAAPGSGLRLSSQASSFRPTAPAPAIDEQGPWMRPASAARTPRMEDRRD